MAKLTLADISQFDTAAIATINANNALIEAALENTHSRDGTTPNDMDAQLDMNGYRIINLPAPAAGTDPARFVDLTSVAQITGIAVPSLSGQSGKVMSNDGVNLSWIAVTTLGVNDTSVVDSGRFSIKSANETLSGNKTFSGTATFTGSAAQFDNNVTLGSSSADTITVNGTASLVNGGSVLSNAIGYRNAPKNAFSADLGLTYADHAGESVYHTSATAHQVTVPHTSTQANFDGKGDMVTIVNMNGGGVITIAPAGSVTLRMAGTTNTGNRSLAANGMATLINIDTNLWYISGAGLT